MTSRSPADLATFQADARARVDRALEEILPAATTEPVNLHAAMRHSVFAGGKRVRPMLVLAGAMACGGDADEAIPAACATELIHTYSLIHDDLPAFDDEALRRGVATCHARFGEAVAILAGDALQALAFQVLARAGRDAAKPRRWVHATYSLASAAGSIGMCGGQTFDIEAAGATIDLEQLRRLHAAKTGALLEGSVHAGALIAGATDAQLAALRRYGAAIGLAFQIVDDLLDVEGSVEDLGKQPGGDAERAQPTFPALLGVDGSRREAEAQCRRAHEALTDFGDAAWPLRALADYIIARSH